MKFILFFISVALLSGCATTSPQQASIQYDSQGNVVSETTPKMSGKAYARMKSIQAAERANSAYYASQAAKYSRVTDGRDIALIDAIAALSGNKGPTNFNDALIAKSQASIEKHRTWAGLGKSVLNGSLVGLGISKTADVIGSALAKDSVSINADNGSTIEGAIGEGNTYTRTEQVSGILTETAPVNPITFGGPESEEEGEEPTEESSGECVDLRPVLPTDPEGIDANEDDLVCSDGDGGVSDN